MMTRVLRWPCEASEGAKISIPVHPSEPICLVGKAPDQVGDHYAFSIWTVDHLRPDKDRDTTGWNRKFTTVLTGEALPEGYDIWRASWISGDTVFHLFEKLGDRGCTHD